jgi:hypothetical protein
MTREELHQKAQQLSKRLLSLPTFSREAIWPDGKIEIQRFFENLVMEIEANEGAAVFNAFKEIDDFWGERLRLLRNRKNVQIRNLKKNGRKL